MGSKKINGDLNVTGSVLLNGVGVISLNAGNIIVLNNLETAGAEGGFPAYFESLPDSSVMNSIPATGLCVLMFNTSCTFFPYVKNQDNRFICNAVYDTGGNSMVARGKLYFYDSTESGSVNTIRIDFDMNYSNAAYGSGINPYGIIRFIGL